MVTGIKQAPLLPPGQDLHLSFSLFLSFQQKKPDGVESTGFGARLPHFESCFL